MKTFFQSRTVWAGIGVTLLSVIATILDVWAVLSTEHTDLLNSIFGPELVGTIGVLMIVLRIITTKPIGRADAAVTKEAVDAVAAAPDAAAAVDRLRDNGLVR